MTNRLALVKHHRKSRETKLAITQVNEMVKIERGSNRNIRDFLRQMERLALEAARKGDIDGFKVPRPARNRLQRMLVNYQIVAFDAGQQRVQRQMRGMELDIISDRIGRINRRQLSRLRSRFDRSTFQTLQQLTVDLERDVRGAIQDVTEGNLNIRSAIRNTTTDNHHAATHIRTATALAYNTARREEYEQFSDIIWGYRYLTVGDDRVREEHAELEGVTMRQNDPRWDRIWPPNGWNCRCTTTPLFEEEETVTPPRGWQPDTGFRF